MGDGFFPVGLIPGDSMTSSPSPEFVWILVMRRHRAEAT